MTTNTGTLQNTYNYLVPAAGTTRGYRVTKEFVPGQIEVCDFRNMSLDGVSFVPSGVLIDNTRGVDNCVVTILEYSWRIVIPAGQFAHMPYPAPYNQTATIEGNAPELTVVFVDYPVIPFFSGSSSGGGSVDGITDIIAGDGISIDKTDPSVPVISATGGGGGGGGSGFSGVFIGNSVGSPTTGVIDPGTNYQSGSIEKVGTDLVISGGVTVKATMTVRRLFGDGDVTFRLLDGDDESVAVLAAPATPGAAGFANVIVFIPPGTYRIESTLAGEDSPYCIFGISLEAY